MTNKPLVNPLGLGSAAKKRRLNYVTASDASRVMAGDWLGLYAEKKGLVEEENLDGKLAVQLGSFTEPMNLWWCERQTGRPVTYHSDNLVNQKSWAMLTGRDAKSEFQVSVEHLFMGCSLDAMSTTAAGAPCVLDAKHTGQFRYDELVERYTPAMTHQCVVMDVDHWALSVFVGNGRHEYVEQACDPWFREELIEREAEFWDYVVRDVEPPDQRPEAPPKPTPRLREFDASAEFGSPDWQRLIADNNWLVDACNAVEQIAETEGAHKAYGAARTVFGNLLPDDIGRFTRQTKHGLFLATRAVTGALTMKVKKES